MVRLHESAAVSERRRAKKTTVRTGRADARLHAMRRWWLWLETFLLLLVALCPTAAATEGKLRSGCPEKCPPCAEKPNCEQTILDPCGCCPVGFLSFLFLYSFLVFSISRLSFSGKEHAFLFALVRVASSSMLSPSSQREKERERKLRTVNGQLLPLLMLFAEGNILSECGTSAFYDKPPCGADSSEAGPLITT